MTSIEGEIVVHMRGWRWRFYVGHTELRRPRLRRWHSDFGTTGIYLVLWGDCVVGSSWRRAT